MDGTDDEDEEDDDEDLGSNANVKAVQEVCEYIIYSMFSICAMPSPDYFARFYVFVS